MERPKQTEIKEKQHFAQKPTEIKSNQAEIKHEKKADEEKKKEKQKSIHENKVKKTEAKVFGKDVGLSTLQSVNICRYIQNKNIDLAINELEQVVQFKKAIPMRGEFPHRKGKIMSGKYPIKASKEFIRLLKSLKANAIANELEIEKFRILCKADFASRPYKALGRGKMKRSNILIKLVASSSAKANEKSK